MISDVRSPRICRISGPTPIGLTMFGKRWSGPGRITKSTMQSTGKVMASDRTTRSHPGVCPRPVGKISPSPKTRPPMVVKTTVSQAAMRATSDPAGPSASAENVIAAVSMPSAYPAPIRTMHQPTAFAGRRSTRSAPTRAKATPRTLSPMSAGSPNPKEPIIGTGSRRRSAIAPTAPAIARSSPSVANGRAR